MELICGKPTYPSKHLKEFPEVTIEHYRRSNTNFGIYSYWELDPHQIAPTYPQTIYGTFPGTIPENPPKFDSGYNTECIRILLIF